MFFASNSAILSFMGYRSPITFLLVCCMCVLVSGAKSQEAERLSTTASGKVELCLNCHRQELDRAHQRQALGCTPCHLGDPLTLDKERAHRGIILNPGELEHVDRTCGRPGCHANQSKWVKNSLMATNLGITSTLMEYWEEKGEPPAVDELMRSGRNSPALDYFRKLCGSCHLWFKRHEHQGFLGEKGGGCTACHLSDTPVGRDATGKKHSKITRWPPLENCVRCHNRSGRIGLSFQGMYESEGYGAPWEDGDFSSDQLDDGRFFKRLPPDVHHTKGMICADCHTQHETMGDGKRRRHWEQQVEVECSTCHGDPRLLASILAENGDKPPRSWPGRKTPALFIQKSGDGYCLKLKREEKCLPLEPPDPVNCLNKHHSRLSCQACHSTWVPQCYGCHVRYDKSRTQLDKISGEETKGLWQEFRSFMRYASPPLGVLGDESGKGKGQVVILVPG